MCEQPIIRTRKMLYIVLIIVYYFGLFLERRKSVDLTSDDFPFLLTLFLTSSVQQEAAYRTSSVWSSPLFPGSVAPTSSFSTPSLPLESMKSVPSSNNSVPFPSVPINLSVGEKPISLSGGSSFPTNSIGDPAKTSSHGNPYFPPIFYHPEANPSPLLFFSPDIHDGTTNDLVTSLHKYNHSLYLFNSKGGLRRFYPASRLAIPRSNVISAKQLHGDLVIPSRNVFRQAKHDMYNMNYVNKVWSLFKDDSLMKEVDAIICMFYPSQCQNYLVFNKTTIFMPAHRIFLKRCNYQQDKNLLHWLFDRPKAHVIVVAAGRYDAEYINYYTGRQVPYLMASNLLSYSPPSHYSPTHDSFLYAPFKQRRYTNSVMRKINDACNRAGFNCSVVTISDVVRGSFSLADLSSFRAAVVFPYAVLSYYLADLISSAVPLFVPSPKMIIQERVLEDSKNKDSFYCGWFWKDLSKHPNSTHPYSPEDYSPQAMEYWLQFAMFYTPCSIVFNSYDELAKLMQTTDYSRVYECNLHYREKVIEYNDREWRHLFAQIQRNRVFPTSVQSALDWFETDSFFSGVCCDSVHSVVKIHHYSSNKHNKPLISTAASPTRCRQSAATYTPTRSPSSSSASSPRRYPTRPARACPQCIP